MSTSSTDFVRTAAIVGAGPAGLMAAETLAAAGVRVELFDRMPSVGRKLLMAGKGGLNITHGEDAAVFLSRYGDRRKHLEASLAAFGPQALREWVHALGITTFVGSSGRVFPGEMKAAPLLRAWLHRLRSAGVKIHVRHRWLGWDERGALRFDARDGERSVQHEVLVLALGGASWPQLGSDGAWTRTLADRGVAISPLQPSNCGFDVGWSEHISTRFSGQPVKPVVATFVGADGIAHRRQGEFVITETGIEGGLVYSASAALRDAIASTGSATLTLDLAPAHDVAGLAAELARSRGSRSMASHIQSRTGIKGVKAALLRELLPRETFDQPERLATAMKALPLRLVRARPVEEAISTAGGVSFDALDEKLMIRSLPGVFCAGEMLDWEAPTGGYLLTACFATGRAAALGAMEWLSDR